MNFYFNSLWGKMDFSSIGYFWAPIAVIATFLTSILWLVIGWRAMRAHERLADAAVRAAGRVSPSA